MDRSTEEIEEKAERLTKALVDLRDYVNSTLGMWDRLDKNSPTGLLYRMRYMGKILDDALRDKPRGPIPRVVYADRDRG